VDRGWDNSELYVGSGLDNARAIRADELDTLFVESLLDLDHIVLGNMFRNTNNKANTGIRGFNHCVSSGGRGNEDQGRIRSSFGNAITDSAINLHTGDRLTSLLSVDTSNNLRAVLLHERRMELTLFANALNNNLCVLIDEEKWLMERGRTAEGGREHPKSELITAV
jgi:hypothetical protein